MGSFAKTQMTGNGGAEGGLFFDELGSGSSFWWLMQSSSNGVLEVWLLGGGFRELFLA